MVQGCTRAAVLDGRVESDRSVCFSQDGVRWLDLATPPPKVAQAAALLTALLSGDPAAVSTVADAEVRGCDVQPLCSPRRHKLLLIAHFFGSLTALQALLRTPR